MNVSILTGRLTADPEIRTTQNGAQVTSFTLAVNRNFKNQAGEYEADFIRCIAFRKTAELIGQYLRKGSRAGVEGRIQTGSYDKPDGTRVYTTEVIVNQVEFLDTKQEAQQGGYQPTTQQPGGWSPQTDSFDNNSALDISEDDLPFSYRL